jgi:hypothetical protein
MRGGFSTPFSMTGGVKRAIMKLNRGVSIATTSRRIYMSSQ